MKNHIGRWFLDWAMRTVWLTLILCFLGWLPAEAQKGTKDFNQLIEDLGNADWTVRSQAVSALGKMKDPQAVPFLIKALKEPKGYVRRRAASALGKIKDPRAI
jgi:HEAT repeat protein